MQASHLIFLRRQLVQAPETSLLLDEPAAMLLLVGTVSIKIFLGCMRELYLVM